MAWNGEYANLYQEAHGGEFGPEIWGVSRNLPQYLHVLGKIPLRNCVRKAMTQLSLGSG